MCGIAGIAVSTAPAAVDTAWLLQILQRLDELGDGEGALSLQRSVLAQLEDRFADLMSLATHHALARHGALRAAVADVAARFQRQESVLSELSRMGRSDLDPLIELLRDYAWQLETELLGQVSRVGALLPAGEDSVRGRSVAWAVEHTLQAIDRLEVRGRDSAGLAIQLVAAAGTTLLVEQRHAEECRRRASDPHAGDRGILAGRSCDGSQPVLCFLYKTANLTGSLGDNGAALRAAVAADLLFWSVAQQAAGVVCLAHTRWASNGIISLPNCHPVNASLAADPAGDPDLATLFALNGDVDNYADLVVDLVTHRGRAIEGSITTDAKIIPIAWRFGSAPGRAAADPLEKLRATMQRLDGSMAVAALDPLWPHGLMLAQKGSGQGLYAASLRDGWACASEAYGLAGLSRQVFSLARGGLSGCVARLELGSSTPRAVDAFDGREARLAPEAIQVFARDIDRGGYSYFLEKEIHAAPASIEKTLRGRYRRDGHRVGFAGLPGDAWSALRERARHGFDRIFVIGQGTAGVAAVGIAHLIERALPGSVCRTSVKAMRSSELSAALDGLQLDGALLIAVSQSGTTTDTNRAVDLARERGAFVHAIVNRRNSDLVRKADSVLFTSDGRDIEMSVASTKAFYAQIVAGKLTALFLASAAGLLGEPALAAEIGELEALPDRLREVLALEAEIAGCARSCAPRARYWAVIGSGLNNIAALEIRIKLSELCYKSVPVDFTEDKKHIDLSTEPLTLVVANDLAPGLVADTAKEVAILRAHNGKPIVLASRGPQHALFAQHAEHVIALPPIGADLGFLLAAAAGHLFAFHAARAIDDGCARIRSLIAGLAEAADSASPKHANAAAAELKGLIVEAAGGRFDSALSAGMVAKLACSLLSVLDARGASDQPALAEATRAAIRCATDAATDCRRPIDTIRHQAKTVTVGTSRPEDVLSQSLRALLKARGIAESCVRPDDRSALAAIARVVAGVGRVAALSASGVGDDLSIVVDWCAPSPSPVDGSATAVVLPPGLIAEALEAGSVRCGFVEGRCCVIVPLGQDAAPHRLACIWVELSPDATARERFEALSRFDTDKPRIDRSIPPHRASEAAEARTG